MIVQTLISILLVSLSGSVVGRIENQENKVDSKIDTVPKNFIDLRDTVDTSDSVSVLLPGLEVNGSRSFHTSNMSTYIPSEREKNTSLDALSLLDNLMIPQIAKDADHSYKALNGTEISYYINGHPAQSDELGGLRVADVNKVCYLDHPSEAKYMGAQYVIEFIVKEYQYGGYTILGDNFYFLGETHFQEAVCSKFTYRRMTYDLYASADNFRYMKSATQSQETYRLNGNTILRQDVPIHSRLETEVYPIKFRAVYSNANTYISNEVGVGKNKLKQKYSNGEIRFGSTGLHEIDLPGNSYDYTLHTPMTERSVSWNVFASFIFGKGWSLAANSTVSHSKYDNSYVYETDEPFYIDRNIKENSLELQLNVSLTKSLSSKSSLSLNVVGRSQSSHSKYTGDDFYANKFRFPKIYGHLAYSYRSSSFSLSTYAGGVAEWSTLNDFRVNTVYPYGVFNIGYSNNRKTQYSLWLQYSTYSPLVSLKNPSLVRQNELFYRSGNPDLKPFPKFELGPSFVWSASDSFTLSASAMYTHLHKVIRSVYSQVNSGDAIVESFSNKGNTNVVETSLFASLSFLGGKLKLSASPAFASYKGKNLDMPNLNSFNFYGSARWYIGRVQIGADVMYFGKQYLSADMIAMRKRKPYYEFNIRWGRGPWKLRMDLINIFQTSWRQHTDYIFSPLYTSVSTAIGIGARQTVIIGGSYTFGYGKKIDRQNELEGGVIGASSAVL